MIKFTKLILVLVALLCASQARAGLILSDLTEDNYIVHENLQWAWASPVNTEFFNGNVLYAPELHAGWRFATDEELNVLKFELTLADFTRADGSYIHAVEYWNSLFDNVSDWDNHLNFVNNQVSSSWVNGSNEYFETFYVRDIPQVSEPNGMLIFILMLAFLLCVPRLQSNK